MARNLTYDVSYSSRKREIAARANQHQQGEPTPYIDYLPEEHAAWHIVMSKLKPIHDQYACQEYITHAPKLRLDPSKLEQIDVVSQRLASLTGWHLKPVGKLIKSAEFLSNLTNRIFPSTLYFRDPQTPFFSSEPDYIHELIGHAAALTSPRINQLYEMFGAAAQYASAGQFDKLMRVFWWTCEVGIAFEQGRWKAFGGALLSSVEEMQRIQDADIRPFDIEAMLGTKYDYKTYQNIYFGASSFNQFMEILEGYLKNYR